MNALALSALPALVALAGAAPEPPRFTGQLERALAPYVKIMVPTQLMAAAAEPLPEPPAAGTRVFTGEIQDVPNYQPLRVFWLEGPEPGLYADLDHDGKITRAERFAPVALAEPPKVKETPCTRTFLVPVSLGERFFQTFPLVVCRPFEWPGGKGEPPLIASVFARASGTVEVGGRKLAASYLLNSATARIELKYTWHALDGNGDGTIDYGFGDTEWAEAAGSTVPVLRAGDHYVSTQAIDPASGRIELRSHPASDYVRAELKPGRELPDFEFTDLAGQKRRLSDFRGRHVLLDFWATTCGPCVAEFPHLKTAYRTYRERGLEILGMVMLDDQKRAAPFVARHELPWPQASWESIEEVAHVRFGIQSLPRVVLLDPQGKILSTGEPGQPPLRGEGLLETLKTRLP